MNTTIHTFPNQGDSPHLPSLGEMCYALRENFYKLDEDDRYAYSLISQVNRMGLSAKLEVHMGARANAWSLLNRNRISL